MKPVLLALVLIVAAGAAGAQTTSTAPASTAGTAGVKQHLKALHYKDVRDLRRGPDGQWIGKTTQNGTEKTVTIAPGGTVTAR